MRTLAQNKLNNRLQSPTRVSGKGEKAIGTDLRSSGYDKTAACDINCRSIIAPLLVMSWRL